MSKFIFFLTLSFTYLGLIQFSSPSKRQLIDIQNIKELAANIKSNKKISNKSPYTVILSDVYREGIFIKTSLIRLKIISPFHKIFSTTYKVSSAYYHYLKPYIGYELLSHNPERNDPLNVFLPPGFSFVGNPILGYWKNVSNVRVWSFYRFYRHLYKDLVWNSPLSIYRPNVSQYRALRRLSQNKGRYISLLPKESLFKKTRERDNLILVINNYFGVNGDHTPYISPEYVDRINNEHWASFSNVISSYYNIFLKPLETIKIGSNL